MSVKITPAHLTPFAAAFEAALREGAISVEQAEIFCHSVYLLMLDQKVRNNERKKALTRENNLGFADPRQKRNHHAKTSSDR